MRHEATRELLLGVAADCEWPLLQFGTLALDGESAWRSAIERATAGERVRLMVALGPALLAATPGGRARIAGPERAQDVADEPCVYGDREAVAMVRAALALMPAPVRWAVQNEAAFLSVGRECTAWTGSAAFVDVTGRRKTRVVVLGPAADIEAVLHESAHVYLYGPPREHSILITEQGETGFRALAAREGWADMIDTHERREERLANALAIAWLFADPESACLPA